LGGHVSLPPKDPRETARLADMLRGGLAQGLAQPKKYSDIRRSRERGFRARFPRQQAQQQPTQKAHVIPLDLLKSEKGEERPGHKYIRRTPDGKGGWNYDYGHTGTKPVQRREAPSSFPIVSPAEVVHVFSDAERATHATKRDRAWLESATSIGLPAETKTAHTIEVGRIRPVRFKDYTPERKALHAAIVDSFTKHVKPVPLDRTPTAIVTMGGSGVGKGSILATLVGDHNDFVVSDPDACKEKLPEYQRALAYGLTADGSTVTAKDAAAMAHEESSDLGEKVRARAVAERKNLILDGTGKNTEKFIGRIEALKAAGYHVHLVMPHIPLAEAVSRVGSRARNTGRYVPDNFVREAHHVIPGNFEQIARRAHEFSLFDNAGPKPRLVWAGGENQPDVVIDPNYVRKFKQTGLRRHLIARARGWMKSMRAVKLVLRRV